MSDPLLPLLVGEAPSKTGDRYHAFPLSGAVAERLCGLAGIEPVPGGTRYGQWTWALYDEFECVNLIERYADATPWRVEVARAGWEKILREYEPHTVVCLGRKVQETVLRRQAPYHEWVEDWGRSIATIPHPSGLNRLLNAVDERDRCGETLRAAMCRRSPW